MLYRIKRIIFNDESRPIILQNLNGPCPLLAVCNALLLHGQLRIHPQQTEIAFEELSVLLKEHLQHLISTASSKQSEHKLANLLQNVDDIHSHIIPKLEEGLDINVRFNGCLKFEYTQEVAFFDILNLRLVHGWLYDPQDIVLAQALQDMSYNQAVDFITKDFVKTRTNSAEVAQCRHSPNNSKNASECSDIDAGDASSTSPATSPPAHSDSKSPLPICEVKPLSDAEIAKLVARQGTIRQFLSETQGQLTVHGLTEMHSTINEGEICIHFRNNHFATVVKRNGYLFQLVTDEGILREAPAIVWQRIGYIDGDDTFLDYNFRVPVSLADDGLNDAVSSQTYARPSSQFAHPPPPPYARAPPSANPRAPESHHRRHPKKDDSCSVL